MAYSVKLCDSPSLAHHKGSASMPRPLRVSLACSQPPLTASGWEKIHLAITVYTFNKFISVLIASKTSLMCGCVGKAGYLYFYKSAPWTARSNLISRDANQIRTRQIPDSTTSLHPQGGRFSFPPFFVRTKKGGRLRSEAARRNFSFLTFLWQQENKPLSTRAKPI